MSEPIKGKVARLLTERDLVINRGMKDGVRVGMRFKILNSNGQAIRDPDSHEVIGSVEMVKVVVKVVEVQENLCVARTFKTIKTEASGVLAGLATMSVTARLAGLGSPGGTRVETLRSNEKFLDEEISESESYVRTGDLAIQVVQVKDGGADVEY